MADKRGGMITLVVFLSAVLMLMIQVGRVFVDERFLFLIDAAMAFFLGLFLASLTVLMFGYLKNKFILYSGVIVAILALAIVGSQSFVFTLFMMVGVIFSLVALSESLLENFGKK